MDEAINCLVVKSDMLTMCVEAGFCQIRSQLMKFGTINIMTVGVALTLPEL